MNQQALFAFLAYPLDAGHLEPGRKPPTVAEVVAFLDLPPSEVEAIVDALVSRKWVKVRRRRVRVTLAGATALGFYDGSRTDSPDNV